MSSRFEGNMTSREGVGGGVDATHRGPVRRSAGSNAAVTGGTSVGRRLLIRLLTGGGDSLGMGCAAAHLVGLYRTGSARSRGMAGGRLDAVMMRIVDIPVWARRIARRMLSRGRVRSAIDGNALAPEAATRGGFRGKKRAAEAAKERGPCRSMTPACDGCADRMETQSDLDTRAGRWR